MATTTDEFTSALNEEFGLTPEVEEPKTEEPETEEPAPADEPKTETVEETANRKEEEAVTEPEAPKFATKDDVAAALREYSQETTGRVEAVHSAAEEIISKLHPEGIDRNLYDSNGNVIKTAQDIVDRGLLNPRTNQPFEYEEAASWILAAQQQMNKNFEELQNYAADIAEQNIQLSESSKRVMEKWGDVLNSLPQDKREKFAEQYLTKQLQFAPDGSYITKVNMTPEEFYDIILEPYTELSSVMAEKQRLETEAKQRDQAAELAERSGLPPQRGTSATKANTGDPMVDALIDEMAKG